MKKVVICFTVLMCFLVLGNVKTVSAAEIDIDDIENSTYVIGKCMFTREISENYSGILTTDVIMLASKTIDSNRLEDMVIYYKTARGVWKNVLTDQEVQMPETVNIQYKNNEVYIEQAKLRNDTLHQWEINHPEEAYIPGLVDGKYTYDLAVYSEMISGYVIYEKVGTDYVSVGEGAPGNPAAIEVYVEPGEKKVFVAKTYALKENGDRLYSEVSDELVIDHTTYVTPVLENITIKQWEINHPNTPYIPNLSAEEEGYYVYDLGINFNAYKNSPNYAAPTVSGYEVYEKEGTNYSDGVEVDFGAAAWAKVQPGEKKVYVVRVFATKVDGTKVYSEYSNEITIDHRTLLTPKLENVTIKTWEQEHLDQPYVAELVEEAYHYDLGIDSSFYQSGSNISVSGYEIYTEQGITYTKVGEGSIGPSETVKVTVAPGERKVFYARVYAITSEGERIYSTYSDNMVIDHSDETP